jgi:hypothetical protein
MLHLDRYSSNRGPAGCVIGLAAIFLNCVYTHTTRIAQKLRRLTVPLTLYFNLRPANQPTIKDVTLCSKNFGDP